MATPIKKFNINTVLLMISKVNFPANKWKKLAIFLEMSDGVSEIDEDKSNGNDEEKRRKLMENWVKSLGTIDHDHQHWMTLIDAIKKCTETAAANKLAEDVGLPISLPPKRISLNEHPIEGSDSERQEKCKDHLKERLLMETRQEQQRLHKCVIPMISVILLFLVVVVIGVLFIVFLVLFLRLIPSHSQFLVLAKTGDTVLVQIPQLMWFNSIDIHLLSSSCSGSILTVNCDRIEKDYKSTKGLNAVEGIYLIQSTTAGIAFNVSRVADRHFHVWLFPSLEAVTEAVETSYYSLACSKPPENTYCKSVRADTLLGQLLPFTISSSSYYYLGCSNTLDANCTTQITIADSYLNKYSYTKTRPFAINQAILNTRSHVVELRLRNSSFSFDPVCVLAQLNNDPDCDENLPQIDMTSYRRDDILILVSVILGVLVVIFIILAACSLIGIIMYCIYQCTAQRTS